MPVEASFLKDILVVIVLYKKKPQECPSFNWLQEATRAHSSPAVFVHDNSPAACAVEYPNIIYYHSQQNVGVSKAYNMAYSYALDAGKKWMLLLDQDTVLTESGLLAFQESVRAHEGIEIFTPLLVDSGSIVSPFRIRWGKGKRLQKIKSGLHTFRSLRMINSGLLITVDAFRRVGGFDERFPLDLSDVVFADRLRQQHPQFVLVNASVGHSLSAKSADVTPDEDLSRFKSFIASVRLYKTISEGFVSLALNILPRSVKLFIRHWDVKFLSAGWRNVF
jgi:GT2 family glycosyltransferase